VSIYRTSSRYLHIKHVRIRERDAHHPGANSRDPEVKEIEPEMPPRFQSAFGAATSYRLVARAGAGR
jgi:hypothetical protein